MENYGWDTLEDDKFYDDFWEEKEEIEKEWTIDSFYKKYKIDLSTINPSSLYNIIGRQEKTIKQKILADEQIIKYLKNALLQGKHDWRLCNDIFENIDFIYLKNLFDIDFINELFIYGNKNRDYIVLASILINTKNQNEIINLIIEDDDLFKVFKERFNYFYSTLNLDNHHLKKLIKKIIDTNSEQYFNNISISSEQAKFILKEDYSIEKLKWLVDKMPKEEIQEFYLNDKRAELVLPYIKNIDIYLNEGIKFGNTAIKNPKFFELLKSDSLIIFRQRINNIEDYSNDPNYIEEKRIIYYDELINSYNPTTGLFKIYELRLENPNLELEQLSTSMDPYIMNNRIDYECHGDKNNFLRKTNQKLSEIVVDALFQDNIYNVWVNIKELLHYDNFLKPSEKIISKENLEFYKLILEIDKCPSNEKVNLYHKLKNKNINLLFYEDIRKTKNLVYQNYKDKLIVPTNHPEFVNKEETNKNNVVTYDLRDKEYYMLVRTLNNKYKQNNSKRAGSSYSIISSVNNDVYGYDNIIYGYNSFDINKIKHVSETDSFSNSFNFYEGTTLNETYHPNRLASIDEIANTGYYSEIIIKNQKTENNKYDEMKPNFVVVYDEVDEQSLKASQDLNIPIVIITKKRTKNNNSTILDIMDKYTNQSNYEEEERQRRR